MKMKMGDGNVTVQQIKDSLMASFNKLPGYEAEFAKDMEGYAWCGKVLSGDPQGHLRHFKTLSDTLEDLYNKNSRHCDLYGVIYRTTGAFSRALEELASSFGFESRVLAINGRASPDVFEYVVSRKHLFKDIYSREHGIYAHALQWLLLALIAKKESIVVNVPELYSRAVKYNSVQKKKYEDAWGKKVEITIWNLIADCFSGANAGSEDYENNLYSMTLRCPQIVTEMSFSKLPDAPWLESYIYNRTQKQSYKGIITRTETELKRSYDPVQNDQGDNFVQGVYIKNNAVKQRLKLMSSAPSPPPAKKQKRGL